MNSIKEIWDKEVHYEASPNLLQTLGKKLIRAFPDDVKGDVLDVGCGNGYLVV